MRYIGSKVSVLQELSRLIQERAPDVRSVCDPFAGTCSVARHLKGLGYRVVTGDLLRLSFAFQVATVRLGTPPKFERLRAILPSSGTAVDMVFAVLAHLGGLPPVDGYISRNFVPRGDAGRMFFTRENGGRIDAIRQEIAKWIELGLVDEDEANYLLAVLLSATDRVANTAGTYYAHLKHFSRKAKNEIALRPIEVIENDIHNDCYCMPAAELVAKADVDLVYLDPPYNERDYSGYYHLPETIVHWDQPEPHGSSGIPKTKRIEKSDFCRPGKASAALEQLVRTARSRYILIHYASDGLIKHEAILDMLASVGETRFDDVSVRSYRTTKSSATGARTVHRLYWCHRQDMLSTKRATRPV